MKTNCRMRQPKNGPNKTEQAFIDDVLYPGKCAGTIKWFGYECIKLRLADKTFYTPDFMALMNDGSLRVFEVKGHWEDDARVKIKVAARQYPFMQFVGVKKATKKSGGGWEKEEF